MSESGLTRLANLIRASETRNWKTYSTPFYETVMATIGHSLKTGGTAGAPISTMKALVYHMSGNGSSQHAWEDHSTPSIRAPGDAIVRMTTSAICGTDLHILKGDVPPVTDGRILGHEGIGVIEEVGAGVTEFQVVDKDIISCITSCTKCEFCRRGMSSHCRRGGWILGNTIDGTQAA